MSQEDVKDEPVAVSPDPAPGQPESGAAGAPEPAAASENAQLRQQVEQLRRQLDEAEQGARKAQDLFIRERAELENFKKRMQRELGESLRFASEPLIRDLLPVVDNLERAVEHGGANDESLLEGVRMVLKALLDILARHGVKRIEARGQAFDPTLHQAMAQVESAEHEPNRVVEQHHSGYLLHERLLRPALVTVNTRKPTGTVESRSDSD